ncbi:hypothetical protein TNIN_413801 [Trichonephila inaurata madagascariensis]|uniref:Uncharacterized protein n=1 Tax=Trichonephila inaurata madagascariensis TaxID=2747483 RepID=A0A8X6XNB3_9ARAC|nr:hypothetical protein TNIN_453981 [Trichonephila inaurata madagascariensis]GFY55574.1 hypothetical protein TNIN_413801 [Trichonephila inaurata madagascariensis]
MDYTRKVKTGHLDGATLTHHMPSIQAICQSWMGANLSDSTRPHCSDNSSSIPLLTSMLRTSAWLMSGKFTFRTYYQRISSRCQIKIWNVCLTECLAFGFLPKK